VAADARSERFDRLLGVSSHELRSRQIAVCGGQNFSVPRGLTYEWPIGAANKNMTNAQVGTKVDGLLHDRVVFACNHTVVVVVEDFPRQAGGDLVESPDCNVNLPSADGLKRLLEYRRTGREAGRRSFTAERLNKPIADQ
jgi:hypothetical protein